MHRVEEYIEQNWDQPVSVEALALVANASVRSLFYSFEKTRGLSPMAFVREVRFRHATKCCKGRDGRQMSLPLLLPAASAISAISPGTIIWPSANILQHVEKGTRLRHKLGQQPRGSARVPTEQALAPR